MSSDLTEGDAAPIVPRERPVSKAVADELQTAALRIRPATAAHRVWQRLFTEEDRQRVGGNLEKCWTQLGTAGMWLAARGGTLEHATIEVAEGLNLLSASSANWLRRELGIDVASGVPSSGRPSWNPDQGRLTLDGQVIRCVRVLKHPSNIQRILDAFQEAGWPSHIDNPLKHGQQQLHQTLRFLNQRLAVIRFRAQEGAKTVIWDRR